MVKIKIELTKQQKFVSGTSYHCDDIKATKKELIQLFGNPEEGDYDKVMYEWSMSALDIPFNIYDWKKYRNFGDDEIIYWHIGARTPEESLFAKILIEQWLKNHKNSWTHQ